MAGESAGRWSGRGSAALGLDGRVDGPGLAEVLAGRDPVDGRQLRHARGDRAVSGFDLTFCAPKSASVLHMLAPAELGGAAGASHEAAVTDAVAYLERNGLGVRRVRSGEQQSPARHRGGGRRIRPPDQPGARPPSPYPPGGGQRRPRCRRPVVGARQSTTLSPPAGHGGRLRLVAPPPPLGRRRGGLEPGSHRRLGGGRRRPRALPAVLAACRVDRRACPPGGAAARRSGRAVSPSTPTDRTRSGVTPSTGSSPAGAGGPTWWASTSASWFGWSAVTATSPRAHGRPDRPRSRAGAPGDHPEPGVRAGSGGDGGRCRARWPPGRCRRTCGHRPWGTAADLRSRWGQEPGRCLGAGGPGRGGA